MRSIIRGTRSFMFPAALLCGLALILVSPVAAQQQDAEAVPHSGDERFEVFVQAFVEIEEIRDELQTELARWHEADRRNEVRRDGDDRIARILEAHGIHRDTFSEFTRLISVDQDQRDAFEEVASRIRDATS